MAATYWQMLKDPRWQRKRLEIMQRDGFKCRQCESEDTTLNVHHTYYAKGRKPWEYESDSLKTLCERCHGKLEGALAEVQLGFNDLAPMHRDFVRGYIRGVRDMRGQAPLFIDDDMMLYGVAAAYGVLFEDLWSRVGTDGSVNTDGLFEVHVRRQAQQQVAAAIESLEKDNAADEEIPGGA